MHGHVKWMNNQCRDKYNGWILRRENEMDDHLVHILAVHNKSHEME